ncbi:hypothetical protein TURU_155031 [Turdus rufiventris]|nr:hypothetical protein TURU_155031 [Turdus rufiventris]
MGAGGGLGLAVLAAAVLCGPGALAGRVLSGNRHVSFSDKERNWYTDEPSCGSEACVVMYHQPTANPGLGGPYLYQWNDDRCNMKHNFICKYAPDVFPTVPAGNPYDTSKPEDQYHIIATETGFHNMVTFPLKATTHGQPGHA